MARAKIEWTDMVWNPTSGCSKVSEGCRNCYAERFARRLAGRCGYPADNPFQVTLRPERLEEPLRWKKRRLVFVNSMGDLFHEAVDEKFIAKVFAVMDLARQHTYCILTKRPGRAAQLLADEDFQFHVGWFQSQAVRELGLPEPEQIGPWPLRNVWLGVSVENQEAADERIPLLLQTPAAVRFISAEPLLGPVDLELYLPYHNHPLKDEWHRNGYHIRRLNIGITEGTLDWIICGGETGPGARPMHPDWVRSLQNQCQAAGVPFFFKSWGMWREACPPDDPIWNGFSPELHYEHGTYFITLGQKAAGRLLDGRTWNEYPEKEVTR